MQTRMQRHLIPTSCGSYRSYYIGYGIYIYIYIRSACICLNCCNLLQICTQMSRSLALYLALRMSTPQCVRIRNFAALHYWLCIVGQNTPDINCRKHVGRGVSRAAFELKTFCRKVNDMCSLLAGYLFNIYTDSLHHSRTTHNAHPCTVITCKAIENLDSG